MHRLFQIALATIILGLASPAAAAVTYTPLTGPAGAALSLTNVEMIGDGVGYGSVNTAGSSALIYKTIDDAATWNQVGTLATNNTSAEGRLELYFAGAEIWYTTLIKTNQYAYGSGRLGVSRDEGASWTDFDDRIDTIMAASGSVRDPFARAPGLPGCFVTTGAMGNTWGLSGDGGATWSWSRNQYFFGRFKAGTSRVYMAGKTEMTVPYYNINRYDPASGGFVNLDAAVPADLYLGPWHVYQGAMAEMLTLTDTETTYTPAAYAVASADAGATFTTYFNGEEGFTLLDALAVSSSVVFIAGQAAGGEETRLQIRMTVNGGADWMTLVDEATTDTAGFIFDGSGTVYAVRTQAGAMGAVGGSVGLWRLSMD